MCGGGEEDGVVLLPHIRNGKTTAVECSGIVDFHCVLILIYAYNTLGRRWMEWELFVCGSVLLSPPWLLLLTTQADLLSGVGERGRERERVVMM